MALNAGSLSKTLAHVVAELDKPSPRHIADGLALLQAWPWAARDGAPLWTETLGLMMLAGADPATATALDKLAQKKPPGKISDHVIKMRAGLLSGGAQLVRARAARRPLAAVAAEADGLPGAPKALHAAWLLRATRRCADDLPSLLTAWMNGPATQAAERALCLADWPPDARIGAAVADALARPIVAMSAEHPLWLVLTGLAVLHPTREAIAAVEDFSLKTPGFRWAERLLALATPLQKPASAPKRKSGAPSTVAEWDAYVYAAPADRQRREVFRDWLLERDPPRGEFLALQLAALDRPATPAEAKRANALQKKHGKAWLGALHPLLRADECIWRGGLLVEATAIPTRPGQVPRPDVAELTALETLTMHFAGDTDGVVELLTGPALAKLKKLGGLDRQWLEPMLAAGHTQVETLGGELDVFDGGIEPLAATPEKNFPRLAGLRLQRMWHAGEPAQLPKVPLARRIRWFSTDAYCTFAEWLDTADSWPSLQTLEILTAQSGPWHWRDDDRPFRIVAARDGKKWRVTIFSGNRHGHAKAREYLSTASARRLSGIVDAP